MLAMAKSKKPRGKKAKKRKEVLEGLNQQRLQLKLAKTAAPSISTAPNSGMPSIFWMRGVFTPLIL